MPFCMFNLNPISHIVWFCSRWWRPPHPPLPESPWLVVTVSHRHPRLYTQIYCHTYRVINTHQCSVSIHKNMHTSLLCNQEPIVAGRLGSVCISIYGMWIIGWFDCPYTTGRRLCGSWTIAPIYLSCYCTWSFPPSSYIKHFHPPRTFFWFVRLVSSFCSVKPFSNKMKLVILRYDCKIYKFRDSNETGAKE